MPGVHPPAFAERKKAACLERSSPPLPKARGRGAGKTSGADVR